MLNLDYDRRHDILQIREQGCGASYGDEDDNGIVIFYSIDTNKTTGIMIYDFRKRLEAGELSQVKVPFHVDIFSQQIKNIVFKETGQHKCVLQ